MDCIACSIVSKQHEAVIVYEDDLICAFMDIDPINDGHILIVPRAHKLDLDALNDDEMLRIMKVSKVILECLREIYEPDGYTVMQNGGAFDDLGHYHFHIFPRYHADDFAWTCKPIVAKDISSEGKRMKELIDSKIML